MAIRRGNNGSYMESTSHTAWLFTDFGESYARKIFGDEYIDSLPKYTKRSKHAGKPKGKLAWRKTTKGGWNTYVKAVIKNNYTYGHGIWETPWGEESKLLIGYNAYSEEEASISLVRK